MFSLAKFSRKEFATQAGVGNSWQMPPELIHKKYKVAYF